MNSQSVFADWGRVVGGFLVAALGLGKIAGAVMLGQVSLAMFKASLAEQFILFVALLAVWVFVFVGGLGFMKDGISNLRAQRTSAP
jgi:hypothetical protein